MDILERLQQRATKMIKELEERLKKARTVQWILFQTDLTFLNQVQIQNRHFVIHSLLQITLGHTWHNFCHVQEALLVTFSCKSSLYFLFLHWLLICEMIIPLISQLDFFKSL